MSCDAERQASDVDRPRPRCGNAFPFHWCEKDEDKKGVAKFETMSQVRRMEK